jgi:hypothetical protein
VNQQDWDAEQRRLLTELNKIAMPQELWRQLDAVVRHWFDEQREADRRWKLHSKQDEHP